MGMDVPDNWNSMETIRLAFGFPTAPEFTGEFLDWWKSLTFEQTRQLRHGKPNELKVLELPPLTIGE